MRLSLLVFLIFLTSSISVLADSRRESAVNIITYWPTGFRVDNTEQGIRVRRLMHKIKALGVNTVIFNFRARMVGGASNEVQSVVPLDQQREEERHLEATIQYAKGLGLQAAFRPILLVVGPKGEFPWEDEHGHLWWHGNIKPANPELWFRSFYNYHSRYMKLAKKTGAAWYSIGAEMHSLTSGLGSRSKTQRFGRPDLWIKFIYQTRQIMGRQVKITYGANFTDQYVLENGIRTWGGEFEQLRHDLTFAARTDEEILHQQYLRSFWNELDFIGVDYYRALGAADTNYPTEYDQLMEVLTPFSHQYAYQLQNSVNQINSVTQTRKQLAIQEVGYRSVEKCFVSPYLYEGDDAPINYQHQAVAWDALLSSVWNPQMEWINSVGIWQVLVDDDSDSTTNGGFSPLGKEPTEKVLKKFFKGERATRTSSPPADPVPSR
ncbi:glycoside hydrolase family 113 [Bdellovibrio sp. HCB290]|uniref:glycoside hydrolase family 113 n=1 Tax=Bdellovibrio sp. HCB290 TaxID=3394356 RepID=UPI0039B6CC04